MKQGIALAVDRFFHGIETLLALLLVAMVVLVFGNVVLRYGFNTGIIVSEELSRFLFIWLVFLGAVVALRDSAHLGMDTLVSRFPKWGQQASALLTQVLILLCCALLLHGCWDQHEFNADSMAPVTGIPMIWVYGVGYVTGTGMALIVLHRIWRIVTGRATRAEMGLAPTEDIA